MPRYIDAEVLKEAIKYYYSHTGEQSTNAEHYAYGVALKEIDRTPTADVAEVKHGEWLEETEYYDDDYSECNVRKVFACSLCGRTERSKQPYCNCGAKMDGKGGEQK